MVVVVLFVNVFVFLFNIISYIGWIIVFMIFMLWILNDYNKWIKNIGNKILSRLFFKILVKGLNNDNKVVFILKFVMFWIN